MLDISDTWLTSHFAMSTLNEDHPLNSPDMSVIADTSQSGMSALPAGPQLAPPEEQQFSPEGTAERQSSIAVFRDSVDVNRPAAASDVDVVSDTNRNSTKCGILALDTSIVPFRVRAKR